MTFSLRLIQQHLWQCTEKGIIVYDLKLHKKRDIRFKHRVYDVAEIGEDEVVVASEAGMLHMSLSGQYHVQRLQGA